MSCPNATGPVDIVHPDDINFCTEKCKLIYDFKSTNISVTNKGDYLSISPSDKTSTPVTYSSTNSGTCKNGGEGKFKVQEIRVYCAKPSGSLHTYAGTRAIGEVILYLSNMTGSGDLIICIPISSGGGVLPKATSELSSIIQNSLQTANRAGETTGLIKGINLNLNNFIPQGSGFYSYTATLPFSPCSNCVNYVVYSPPDTIGLPNTIIDSLITIIGTASTNVKLSSQQNIGYAYNQKGAIFGSNDEDIVIDCQPIGSDGEILISEPKSGSSNILLGLSPDTIASIKQVLLIIGIIMLSIMGLLFIIFGTRWVLSKTGFKSSTEVTRKT